MNPVYHVKRLWNNKKNKMCLQRYLAGGKTESLDMIYNAGLLEEKWAFKDAGCYTEGRFDWAAKASIDLSIIIPLYNSEKFIVTCIEQFVRQDTKYQFELILINDGSSDQTGVIVREFQEKYPDLIIFIDQANQGISCARNAGIQMARGRYLCFVDHDDLVESCFVEKLMEAAYREDADIVKGAHAKVEDGKTKQIYEEIDEIILGDMQEKLFQYASYIFPGVYKRELFSNVNFPKSYWYEDMIVRMLLYRQSARFVHISDVLYRKQFHSSNAFSVVWDNKNYKCLEQLYLVMNLVETNKRLGLPEDVWFYQCVLHEFSKIFYQRMCGLDENTKQMAFLKACEILNKLYKPEYLDSLKDKDRLWHRAFAQQEYTLWRLLGEV